MAAIGLLIGVASRSEEQATAFSLILMFVLAGLGGAWVIDAYENVVQRGLGISSVLMSCALLLACAAGLAVLAALRFRRQSA